jgi:hypothetical protein
MCNRMPLVIDDFLLVPVSLFRIYKICTRRQQLLKLKVEESLSRGKTESLNEREECDISWSIASCPSAI